MQSLRFARFAPVALAALLVACGDSTAPAPPAVDNLIQAADAAQGLGAAGVTLGGGIAPPAASHASGCAFNAASQSFVCPGRTNESVTFQRSFQLLDASGAPQSAYNPATTAAVRTITDLAGTRSVSNPSGSGLAVAFEHHSDHTLSGLLTGTHTLNGSSSGETTVTPTGGSSYVITAAQTIDDLVLPKRGESQFPQSGTISTTVTTPGLLGIGTHTSTVLMAFDGTSVVALTITSGSVTASCTIDLAVRGAFPVCN
jgi:hypothetical protein